MNPLIILGPPGTGKTTTLLRMVEDELSKGRKPNRIGYFAFTRRAAYEARDRACSRFRLDPDELPYFRTLHSFAFRQIGASRADMLDRNGIRDFGNHIGMPVSGVWNAEDGIYTGGLREADRYLFLENRARVRCVEPEQEFYESGEFLDRHMFQWICSSLREYKKSLGLFDYTDTIEQFIDRGHCPSFDTVFIDEAQDLTRQQWKMVEKIAASTDKLVIAGDDDQAIFRWAGADVEYFINLRGKSRVLNQSYRVPINVMKLAKQICSRISERRPKEWRAKNEQGSVCYDMSPEYIDMSRGSWLVLARNHWLLKPAIEQCRTEGLLYKYQGRNSVEPNALQAIIDWEKLRKDKKLDSNMKERIKTYLPKDQQDLLTKSGPTLPIWHEALTGIPAKDRLYLIAALARGEKPTKDPRVTLSTIHGSKGGEADNVILLTTIARKTFDEELVNPDDECRVFYVGVTRAKENLHIVEPQTARYFRI